MDRYGRILVVDDAEPIRDLLNVALTNEGYDVQVAIHGREALLKLAVFKPHVVILDMWMPVMDGWEFLRTYRQLDSQSAAIIAFSAADLDVCRARAWGVTTFIEKPFDLLTLLDCVQTHLTARTA